MTTLLPVKPASSNPLKNQVYFNGEVPEAITSNSAVCPGGMETLARSFSIRGGSLTQSPTLLLVTLRTVLETSTEYCPSLSCETTSRIILVPV